MSSRSLTSVDIPKTYAELRRAVEITMIRGQREVERAKLETYWRTGALIDRHLTLHKEETGHGTQTMRRLARDLDFEESLLYRCLRFARTYPIFAARQKLLWAHYRVLLEVEDPATRRALELEAGARSWKVAELERRVRALNAIDVAPGKTAGGASSAPAIKPLVPKRGTVGVCRVIADGAALSVDLGFTCYVDLPTATRLEAGAFVRVNDDGGFAPAPDATKADLYAYRATVLRVVDGDTLWVKIHLRPDLWIKEKLRLRGLDCSELNTPEGKAAKRFVEALVVRAQGVTITTTKPDKWDRYLSDVFLEMADGDLFLNNHLLANGHARRMDEYALTDWDPAG
jgi:endonuclease YncB( thermonuclease family)